IGEGGMATVFRAKRIDSEVQKDVAIKVFNHNYLPSRLLHQFAIEQAIMARLDHENLVSLHHNGMTEDGTAFIVMDYVQQAKTLDDYVRQLELQPQDQAALIINIAEGLSHAHANLVVHRDIKPSNILVNNNGVIKIVDFGIAKLLDQQHEIDASATLVALTPHYAAPEQILDNRVSVQSDIYSLAAVFLGLLIGKKPLQDDRLLKQCSTDEAVIREHLLHLNADQDLKNILNKALQTDPAKRYNTMQAFADELKNWLQQKPVQATPDSWWYRLKKFAQRRTALTATIITLFISLIVGVSAILWQTQETQKAAAKANSIKDFMLNTYAVVDPDVSQGRDIKARELLLSSYDQLNNNQQMDQELRFELMQNMGIASARIGAYEQALEMMRKSLEIKPNDSTSRTYLLQLLVANGELSEAEQWLTNHPFYGILTQADQQRLLRAKLLMYSKLGKFETTKNIADELMALPAFKVSRQSVIIWLLQSCISVNLNLIKRCDCWNKL
ncbi:MAG: protein kinase, partial [Xanthomonadales bacterium]|nr:protein kinase [Xanthomonadales bacterium]